MSGEVVPIGGPQRLIYDTDLPPMERREFMDMGTLSELVVVYDRATSDKLDILTGEIEKLSRRLAETQALVGELAGAADSPIEVRELEDKAALSEIKAYFEDHHGKTLYPDDVAEALRLYVSQVIRLCSQLEEEGEIGQVKEG